MKETTIENTWIKTSISKTELEGPYECSSCGGHAMLDATFLDQVEKRVKCPYCDTQNMVVE